MFRRREFTFAYIIVPPDVAIRNVPGPSRSTGEPQWIDPIKRIRTVLIEVYTTGQTDRVCLDKASDIRIIKPKRVVVQTSLTIQVLALKPQVLLFDEMRLTHFLQGIAPDLIACLPDRFATVIRQLFGQAIEIGMVVAHLLVLPCTVNPSQRFVTVFRLRTSSQ